VKEASVGERNAGLYWAACRARDRLLAREVQPATFDQILEELRYVVVRVLAPSDIR
jgi:hypothetical protein